MKKTKKTGRLVSVVTADTMANAKKLADKKGLSVSALISYIITKMAEEEK